MTSLSLRGIGKTYSGGVKVIEGLDLDIHNGEFMVFVGPSGCGKTTLLRMIAGLEDITSGEIRFGDEPVNHLGPAERGAAMVFQSYALYPHMTVAQNLGFGLKMAGASKAEQDKAVAQVAQTLQITPLLDRKPKALSGGQRQRVAIGRAIVRKPKVFLFDEPLSNLDANLRVQMRVELGRMHQDMGTTMVYVTHDQVEAMTLGQRIAVFNAGRIEQVGTPLQLYHHPANLFVAEFLGSPKMNLLPGQFQLGNQGQAQVRVADGGVWDMPAQALGADRADWQRLKTVGARPEDLQVQPPGDSGPSVRATVGLVEQLGESTVVYVRVAGFEQDLALRLPGSVAGIKAGQVLNLICPPDKLRCFDAQGHALCSPPPA
jgi:multiple sugar transport system ATP-binding protein